MYVVYRLVIGLCCTATTTSSQDFIYFPSRSYFYNIKLALTFEFGADFNKLCEDRILYCLLSAIFLQRLC